MGEFADRVRAGELARPHRPADPQHRQHRHRRLRPRAGDGLRGAAALQRPRPDVPLRVQRRRHRLRRGDPRPRPGRDAVHRLVQDVHHARDDDQRRRPRATGSSTRSGNTAADRQALRRRVDQRRAVSRVRHRRHEHVRLLGLGRRPLLDGLRHRAVDDDRGRPGRFRRAARRLPRHGRALPHRAARVEPAGPARAADRLVRRLLRRPDPGRAAVRPVPQAVPGLPAAADDGVQRQARDAGRRHRRLRDRARSTGASRAPTASTASTS